MNNIKVIKMGASDGEFARDVVTSLKLASLLLLTELPEAFAAIIHELQKEWLNLVANTEQHAELMRHNPKESTIGNYGFIPHERQSILSRTGYSLIFGETEDTLGDLPTVLPPRFIRLMDSYKQQQSEVYTRIAASIAGACHLSEPVERSAIDATYRFHSYPPVTQPAARELVHGKKVMLTEDRGGLVTFDRHVDLGTLTFILYANNVSTGLSFYDSDSGTFHQFNLNDYVSSDSPAILVFVGKALEVTSSSVFKALEHRVEARPGKQYLERNALVTFFLPSPAPTWLGEVATQTVEAIAQEKDEQYRELDAAEFEHVVCQF